MNRHKHGRTSNFRKFQRLLISVLILALFVLSMVDNRAAMAIVNLPLSTNLPLQGAILKEQIQLQSEFQELIFRNQHPYQECSKRRILLPFPQKQHDGFALELQFFARLLMTAMASDRTLVLLSNYTSAYAPHGCQWSSIATIIHQQPQQEISNTIRTSGPWTCLYEAFSNCTQNSSLADTAEHDRVYSANLKASIGLLSNSQSNYFSAKHYGNRRVVSAEQFMFLDGNIHNDIIEHWERSMGRFWIRSQMVHYLWKLTEGLRHEIEPRLPAHKLLLTGGNHKPFIGMHIRFTDNIRSFRSDFQRDANITRCLGHYMAEALDLKGETGVSRIYLATDSTVVLKDLQQSEYRKDFEFFIQENVERTNSTKWTWFKDSRSSSGPAIATDLEVLRQADYLIGSFQSNVYRAATGLNAAYHVGKYPISWHRHRMVDVEWYEDP